MVNRIKYFRALKNLTQQELADLLQVKRLTISAAERNSSATRLELAQKISRIFNKKVDDLFPIDGYVDTDPDVEGDLKNLRT